MLRFLFIYTVIICADLTVIWWDMPCRWIVKPLVVLSLLTYYIYHRRTQWNGTDTLFAAALGAAWLGDVLLLDDGMFLFGLGAFLIMQVLYTFLFLRQRGNYIRSQIPYAFLLMAIILMVLRPMWPDLADLQWPVAAYTIAIGAMAWTAALRRQDISGYWWIVIGTILFMISDSALALGLFTDIEVGKLTVMSTYAAAQYLITQGFLDQQRDLATS